ncbi:MAG TPA: lipocalin-like domain-containing protein, partial [Chloroflexota bacterium]
MGRVKGTSFLLGLLLLLFTAGCSGGAATSPLAVAPAPTPTAVAPKPVVLPADEAPHDNLSEWWYYTGHLKTGVGKEYGFEFVIFQGVRSGSPVGYASHFAMT